MKKDDEQKLPPKPMMIIPSWFSKDEHPDYQPGPVKTYTLEELEEYERLRDDPS